MRKLIVAAGLLALLSLTACQGSTEPEAPPPKKSLARPAQMYEGQEQIQSVQAGSVELGEGGALVLKASGTTESAGWTDPAFLPRIYAATPPDGIYEVDVIATKPATPTAQVATPIEAQGAWSKYTDGRVKGVKFMTKTNEVVAMVAPPAS